MNAALALSKSDDWMFQEAHGRMKDIEDELTTPEALHADHSDIEQLIKAKGFELMRSLLQGHLDWRASQEQKVPVEAADGIARTKAREKERTLETVFGEVTVNRQMYQAQGAEGLAPMDAALNLPEEHYSHGLRRLVAEESPLGSFDEVVERISRHTGAHVPKRQVEELAARAATDFDDFYAERAVEAEETEALMILSFDGKGIAMRHESLRAATRAAAEATPKRLQTRLTRGEKRNRKRMATVATVYTIEPWLRTPADVLHTLRDKETEKKRPRPSNKRVWASVEHNAQRVINDGFAEALRRDPERKRTWVVLVDGQRDQLRHIREAARKAKVNTTIVLDIVHVLEYLWKAAYVFHAEGSEEAETWVRDRLFALLKGRSGGTVARSIRDMVKRRSLSTEDAEPAERCACYLVANTRYLHYDRALAAGFPIATGVIEGACRHLIQDRMGRTGARWSLTGAEAVLRLRALRASGDFEAYWRFHLEREKKRVHLEHYANATAPDPLPRTRPMLTLVK